MSQPFKKLSFDEIDATMEAVSSFAKEKAVPTLVHPPAKETVAAAPIPYVQPVPVEKKPLRLKRTQFVRTAVDLPKYLVDQIAERHFKTRKTKRSIITQAFKDAGFKVDDRDINEDNDDAA